MYIFVCCIKGVQIMPRKQANNDNKQHEKPQQYSHMYAGWSAVLPSKNSLECVGGKVT